MCGFRDLTDISIHAPRTGSDARARRIAICSDDFNPRSPHGERPARNLRASPGPDFNPRSPHGERPQIPNEGAKTSAFQSTLPARGATGNGTETILLASTFQSTLPARGATKRRVPRVHHAHISIHAPRTGSDAIFANVLKTCNNFNPRSPHGERRDTYFLGCLYAWDFNPRSPHGERPQRARRSACRMTFQSTLPARGATSKYGSDVRMSADFNPRSPHGERPTST